MSFSFFLGERKKNCFKRKGKKKWRPWQILSSTQFLISFCWEVYSQMNSKPSLFSNDKIPEEQLSFRNSFFCDDFPMFCTSGWRAFKFVGVRCFLKVPNGNVQVHPHNFEILIFWSLLNRSDIQLNYFPEFSHIRPRDSHLNAIF